MRLVTIGVVLAATTLILQSVSSVAAAEATLDDKKDKNDRDEYILVGVSGGLQKGFPDTVGLHYFDRPPVFLGRALVRGYKSYLDVMQPSWRQYVKEPLSDDKKKALLGTQRQPLINCNVIPTGCWHDANEYWIYLVALPQFHNILMKEPRFLSIAADLGLVDLQEDETGPLVKHVAVTWAQQHNKTSLTAAALPLVTGAWYNPESHVPSPILYTKPDGTRVTNFPDSLALWARVYGMYENIQPTERNCTLRVGPVDEQVSCTSPTEAEYQDFRQKRKRRSELYSSYYSIYWQAIWSTIRRSETTLRNKKGDDDGTNDDDDVSPTSWAATCDKKARFGASPDMARINTAQTKGAWNELLQSYNDNGVVVDWEQGEVVVRTTTTTTESNEEL